MINNWFVAAWPFLWSDVNHAAWCVATYGIRYDLCSRFSNSISLQTADVNINAFISGIEHLVAEHAQANCFHDEAVCKTLRINWTSYRYL